MKFLRWLFFVFIFSLTACSGGGKCDTSNTPIGNLNLMLTAPNQYPAGIATTAYILITNNSTVAANNLSFSIPSATNYTGVDISIINANDCANLTPSASCQLAVSIPAGSSPGSFTIIATPNGVSTQINKQSANNISLTVNIGLTEMTPNLESGANGISFLYHSTVPSSESGDIPVMIVGVVNSATAGLFNTINLTSATGTPLNFEVLSGNSGNNLTNLLQGSVVTFLLKLPAGTTSYEFYAQTMENRTLVDQGTISHPIGVSSLGTGILTVQPTKFALSDKTGYTKQVVTYTNTGTGEITDLSFNFASPSSSYSILNNNCGTTLAPGSFCTLEVHAAPEIDENGSATLVANSSVGNANSQFSYEGLDARFGINMTAENNFIFSANTINTSDTTLVILSNTGNVVESSFEINIMSPSNFTITQYGGTNACTLNGSVVTNILNSGDSCVFVLTYDAGSNITENTTMINTTYKTINNQTRMSPSIEISYETVQASAVLAMSPASPFTFATIIANNRESISQAFTVTNLGPDVATTVDIGANVLDDNGILALYTLENPTSGNYCSNVSNLAVGESCVFAVKFGPTTAVYESYNGTLAYSSLGATGGSSQAQLGLNASSRAPNSAVVGLTNVTFNPTAVAGNGIYESQILQFESSATPVQLTFTYTNTSIHTAEDFYINTSILSGVYTVDLGTSTCPTSNLNASNLEPNSTCILILDLNRSVVGNKSLSLSQLGGNWIDESAIRTNILMPSSTYINNIIYTNVYGLPAISFSPAMIQVAANGGIANVNATLSGGYNVESFTVGLNTTNTNNELTANTCTVSSQYPTCMIQVTGAESIEYESSTYILTGTQNGSAGFNNSVSARVYGVWLDYNSNLTANSMPYSPYGTSLVYLRDSVLTSGILYMGYIQSQDSVTSGKVDVRPVVYSRSPDVNSNWDWVESNIGPFTIDKTESISISLLNVTSHIVVGAYNDPTNSNKIHIWVGPNVFSTIADPNANGVSPQMAFNSSSIQSMFLMYVDNTNNLVVKAGAIDDFGNIPSWIAYGVPVASNVVNNMSALSMVVYDGKVYVSYQDNTGIHIAVGNGTSWTDVTTGLSSICTTTGSAAKLAANNNMMYILSGCYNTGQNAAIITTAKFNKDTSQWVGNFGYAAQRSNIPYTNLSAAITSTQNIGYIAFQNSSDFVANPFMSVYRIFLDTASPAAATLYNVGSSFGAMFPSVPSITMSLALGRNNEPYLAFDAYNPDDLLYSVNVMGYPYKFR